ncbi:DUF445 domain-containing protein [Myxococcota bacterium]|nr:DUF445 domain-containing protein [Myxococcota bacterium]
MTATMTPEKTSAHLDRGEGRPTAGGVRRPGGTGAGGERRGRERLWAHLLLLLMAVLFVAAHLGQARWPWLRHVGTMAEAGLAGGLADWFAVTALFRHPLGLPIPHTAIIPRSRERIASELSSFLEPFVEEDNLRGYLAGRALTRHALDWLGVRDNARRVVDLAAGMIAGELELLGDADLQEAILRQVDPVLDSLDLAPLAGRVLQGLTEEDLGGRVTAEGARILADVLEDPQFQKWMEGAIRRKDSGILASLKGYVVAYFADTEREKLVADLRAMAGDPLHLWHGRARRLMDEVVAKLRDDPEWRRAGEKLKREVLSAGLRDYAKEVSGQVRGRILRHARDPESSLRRRLADALWRIAGDLRGNAGFCARVDAVLAEAVPGAVGAMYPEIRGLIVSTMGSWDLGKMSKNIEEKIGDHLQYIRINGTLVGAAVGGVIAAVSALLPG